MIRLKEDLEAILQEWVDLNHSQEGDLFVIGCSTSEISGHRIGSSGSEEIARDLFGAFSSFQKKTGVELAFQCCEHLNRALVVEKKTMKERGLTQVSAVPVPKAGGSMASFAYRHMADPVLVETIEADAGIDIGDTFIGMHLKRVAVPIRLKKKQIGKAHVTMAKTRPKLIGGERAVYTLDQKHGEV
ncbi:TIGR01440 family protein [Bacillaceae bacterium S4-13-58]